MVINNYFECLAKPAKSAKLLNTAFFASLADLARTLKKFSYNYLALFMSIEHSGASKLRFDTPFDMSSDENNAITCKTDSTLAFSLNEGGWAGAGLDGTPCL